MHYENLIISSARSIIDAIKQLDAVKPKILFVVNEKVLVGTLTDGDVRRHLLKGGNLDDSVAKAANVNPNISRNTNEASCLLKGNSFLAIPIVDEKKQLLDIYVAENICYSPTARINLPVVINAGGRGKRLEPFTSVLPKPLIPVGDLPIIEHIMKRYHEFGCHDFHVIVNYKKQLLKSYFTESETKYQLNWYDEMKPLDTGGGLSLLKGKLDSTFFFTNCDILLLADYESMLEFHREHNNVITMVCAYKNVTIPYGVIEMGINGAIQTMKEKPELSFLTNTGMYIVEPEVVEEMVPDVPISFPDIIKAQMEKGKNVAAYPVSENDWLDMGQLSELKKMRERLYGE